MGGPGWASRQSGLGFRLEWVELGFVGGVQLMSDWKWPTVWTQAQTVWSSPTHAHSRLDVRRAHKVFPNLHL